ncbi:hypothetical protein [Streptomyces iranensis]|uniref:Uncharacterized protein n=1 Tax=Streptomyces iranensis TaxID=576784 RepID=A0A061A1D4_9ACTN|nr:hypothetical protein [Streptomyces iranensis]MBP2059920.1 hypothetical protein [Streptomyces iranensis]CDR14495.1 predicted protein [Streptomyces iranensis]
MAVAVDHPDSGFMAIGIGRKDDRTSLGGRSWWHVLREGEDTC